MKKYTIPLLILFSFLALISIWQIKSNKIALTKNKIQVPSVQKESFLIVKNKLRIFVLTLKGQITKNKESDVFFNVEGKLEDGEIGLKRGTEFKFNQLLYKINSEELFYSICAEKASLAKNILDQMEFITLNFTSEKSKWQFFLNDFSMVTTLPEFPKVETKEEKLFILEKDILAQYMKIKSLEKKMSNYIFLAPFDGKVTEIYSEIGSFVNPTIRIAKISKNSKLEVKVPIELSFLKECKKAKKVRFVDASGFEIGKGKMVRTANKIDYKNQKIEVYYSLEPTYSEDLYSGQIVITEIEFEKPLSCCTVPLNSVKDKKVTVLVGNKIVKRNIILIDFKSDSLIVSGLKNGDKIVM